MVGGGVLLEPRVTKKKEDRVRFKKELSTEDERRKIIVAVA